jgi:hypothetical protein
VSAEIEKWHNLIYSCTTVKKRNFSSRLVCNDWKPNLSMNSKRIFCVICCAAVMMTASVALGASRGGGGHFGGMSRGGQSFGRGGMNTGGARSIAGSTRNFSGRTFDGRRSSGRHFSGNRHHFHGRGFNRTVFIGGFGFPWWWGWGWGWGYPYGYNGYGYPYGYGYGYGYDGYGYGGYGYDSDRSGYDKSSEAPTRSRVAELQRRLARAGYYRGAVDGILGPQTREAIRAYERAQGDAG